MSTKFLGVHVDEMLTWSVHINVLRLNPIKAVGLIRVASRCVPRSVLLSLYYAYFNSHIMYNLLIWGSTYTTYLQPIRVLQKKCIRIVAGANWYEHAMPLALDLGLLLLDDLYIYCVSTFMFKIFHHMLPECIVNLFVHTIILFII